jgi:RepB plasmid partitioning protein/ParB-like nuclease family protein
MPKDVRRAFALEGIVLPLTGILPVKQIKPTLKISPKFQQILASIREVGIIEPLVVFPQNSAAKTYLLIDGHVRFEALKQLGKTEAPCLISTDDEAYTYNSRISRLATVQEHAMILKAIKSGVPEEKIARALNVDIRSITQRRDLLNGICGEAADLLKNRHVAPMVFPVLKKMKPMRQIEVVELMSAAANFSVPYAKALLAATPPAMLIDPDRRKISEGLTPEQLAKMEKEMEALQRDLKVVEDSHGNAVLNLVLARGYLSKLFDNHRVARYLSQNHAEIYQELQKVADGASLDS